MLKVRLRKVVFDRVEIKVNSGEVSQEHVIFFSLHPYRFENKISYPSESERVSVE